MDAAPLGATEQQERIRKASLEDSDRHAYLVVVVCHTNIECAIQERSRCVVKGLRDPGARVQVPSIREVLQN